MAAFTNTVEKAILNFIIGSDAAYGDTASAPRGGTSTLYIALCTTAAASIANTHASVTEVSAADYDRKTITFDNATGDPATISGPATASGGISWTETTNDWSTVASFAITTASSKSTALSASNTVWLGGMTNARAVPVGVIVSIDELAIVLQLD